MSDTDLWARASVAETQVVVDDANIREVLPLSVYAFLYCVVTL